MVSPVMAFFATIGSARGAAQRRARGFGLAPDRDSRIAPIQFEAELGEDLGRLREWARENVVKLLVFCHPDDDDRPAAEQEARVKRLLSGTRATVWNFCLEMIPSKVGALTTEPQPR